MAKSKKNNFHDMRKPYKVSQPILGQDETRELHEAINKRELRIKGRTIRLVGNEQESAINVDFFLDESNRSVHPA